MLDKTKRYLVVGLGLLGGKYALELTKAGSMWTASTAARVTCSTRWSTAISPAARPMILRILSGRPTTSSLACTPPPCWSGSSTYGHLLKPGCIFTDVSGVKTGLVEPVQALCPAGVEFIASHPMAGRETSSVEHAAEVNFAPANFIITPTEKNTPEASSGQRSWPRCWASSTSAP